MLHRPPRSRAREADIRTSDLILALLSVVLLGGLALTAAFVLSFGPSA